MHIASIFHRILIYLLIYFSIIVITIPRVSKKEDGKRVYDKLHYCLFCAKPFPKVPRHARVEHKEEELVKNAESCTDEEEKDKRWDKIRNKGDYLHNAKYLEQEVI